MASEEYRISLDTLLEEAGLDSVNIKRVKYNSNHSHYVIKLEDGRKIRIELNTDDSIANVPMFIGDRCVSTELYNLASREERALKILEGSGLYPKIYLITRNDGMLVIVREDLLANTLEDTLKRVCKLLRRKNSDKTSLYDLLNEVQESLKRYWNLKLSHNDINVTNILVDDEDRLYIIDWETSSKLGKSNFNVDLQPKELDLARILVDLSRQISYNLNKHKVYGVQIVADVFLENFDRELLREALRGVGEHYRDLTMGKNVWRGVIKEIAEYIIYYYLL